MKNIEELQRRYDEVKEQEKQGWAYEEDFIDVKERIQIEKELFTLLTREVLDSMDEDGKYGEYDVYYQPNERSVYLVGGFGMAYDGDDEDAFKVLQIEGGEIL